RADRAPRRRAAVSAAEAALARQALRSAEGCARRLARSQGKLAAQFPLSPARVTALPPDVEDDLDAFLKRYEQLVNTIQDELFKVVAIVGGEDVRGLARREMAELMDRLGALPSAASFRLLVAIRNRIAHSYPDDPERQAGNLNAAYEAVPDLLAAHEGVRRYLERRLPGG
ncbi:MAG: hypothetical protein Q8Q85_01885, partial [Gemmatimonadales bacterium]|nr:hypothetical protein [Gemmatimonadales bacterium]